MVGDRVEHADLPNEKDIKALKAAEEMATKDKAYRSGM